jgi:hypothetical protein
MFTIKQSPSLAAALLMGASISMVACSEEAPVVEEEVGIAGLTIENARLVLAPVEGNPAALYFDFAYEGDRAFNVDRFAIEGAGSSVMHQYGEYDFKVQMMEALPIPVTGGTTLEFKPGDLHVMAMDVSPELQPGVTTEVTMTISGGDTHSFTAEVRGAGEER